MNRLPSSTVLQLLLLFSFVVVHGVQSDAQDTAKDTVKKPVVDSQELYKPGLLPDRIILTWAGDPAKTQAVTWRTSAEVTQPVAQIIVAHPGANLEKGSRTVNAVTEALTTDLSTAHYHSVRFEGLTASTRYAYRVGDGTNWSEWFHFSTASSKSEPFSFVYFGDAQNDLRSMWSRVIRESSRTAPAARFMIHAGDLINNAENDAQWGEWFGAGSWLNAMVPSVPIPGNHEQAKIDLLHHRLSHHWRPQFTLPENGPAGLEESCFSLLYQDTLIVGLNSNEKLVEQIEWLDQLLSSNKARWVVCTFHHPIFSTGKNRDNSALRKLWKPILDKHRVDLVLQGHDHTYGRTGLTTPGAAWTNETNAIVENADPELHEGTVYVVSVSGPKFYDLQKHPFMKRHAEDTQLFQIIHVNGDQLHFEAYTAVGELYDAFTLTKQPGAPNRMTEQVPDVPERLRPPVVGKATTAKEASEKLKSDANAKVPAP